MLDTHRFTERILEILPGALTWLVLTSPLWLTLSLPFFMAGVILFLDVYWCYRSLRIAVFSWIGYKKMLEAEKTDWLTRLEKDNPKVEVYGKEYSWRDIHHLFVIPTYKEPVEILAQSLEALSKQTYPNERIMVLVAWEDREEIDYLKEKERILIDKFGGAFSDLFFTIHPLKVLKEHHPGPGSNRTYAVKEIIPLLKEKGLDPAQVVLTTLDADFVAHRRYTAGLTYKYLTTPKAEKKTFTGIFWYYNNFWQAPTLNRLVASGVSFWQLSEMTGSNKYFNFSSHSINLQSLIDMNYWVVDKVNDDGEFYWRAYYHFAGDYKVIPHFISIYADTVQAETLKESLKEQYLQLRRWAYGVEHIPMIVKQFFKRKDIPFLDKADKILFLLQSYLTWSSLAILITFGGWILQVINPRFAGTVLAFNLPYFSSIFLSIAIVGLFMLVFIHEKVITPRPKEWGIIKRLLSYLQWALVPIVILTYGSFPAIESQSRLMLGRYMEYRVTKKVRT
ncbi:glycosyltransferase family 2 protein [Patescibacteria group bacterium]|nr:glycosyltransferase family 2 protein [Patescibacteria group bacterium]